MHLTGTPVKSAADEFGLRVFQPADINAQESVDFLGSCRAQFFVVVAYGQILSRQVLGLASRAALNAHASLLPRYRGAAPVARALLHGETVTGVTVIMLSEKMDAGPVVLQESVCIAEDDDAVSLEERLSILSADLLVKAVAHIEAHAVRVRPQDPLQVSYAPKLKKEDGLIDWNQPATALRNRVRACARWPQAHTHYRGRFLKIYSAALGPRSRLRETPGEIAWVLPDGIAVQTGEGVLILKELQLEGGRRMQASEFVVGHRIQQGEVLG